MHTFPNIIWPLEVHVINYYRHIIQGNLSNEDIQTIANDFCKSNNSLLFFSQEFYDRYKNSCIFYLKQFIGIDRDTVINKLIGYWKTWDCFAANTMFIDVFRKYLKNMFTTIRCLSHIKTNGDKY